MNLSFRTKWPKGKSTYFVEKILSGLCVHLNLLVDISTINPMKYHFSELVYTDCISKIHTIRKDEKSRWKKGMKIHFFINSRTKNMFQFAPIVPVMSIQKIKIECPTDYLNDQRIYIDEKLLTTEEMQQLAWNDGFESLAHFQLWFNSDFEGIIIHWTDLKY